MVRAGHGDVDRVELTDGIVGIVENNEGWIIGLNLDHHRR